MTDDKTYKAAVSTFLIEPEALTVNQIDVLLKRDDQLGARALHKRDASHIKAAEARHRVALGRTLDKAAQKAAELEQLADSVIDHVLLALVAPKARIKTLEERNERLEQRVLELEAALAASGVDHVSS